MPWTAAISFLRPPHNRQRITTLARSNQSTLFKRLHRIAIGRERAHDLIGFHIAQNRLTSKRIRLQLIPLLQMRQQIQDFESFPIFSGTRLGRMANPCWRISDCTLFMRQVDRASILRYGPTVTSVAEKSRFHSKYPTGHSLTACSCQ